MAISGATLKESWSWESSIGAPWDQNLWASRCGGGCTVKTLRRWCPDGILILMATDATLVPFSMKEPFWNPEIHSEKPLPAFWRDFARDLSSYFAENHVNTSR